MMNPCKKASKFLAFLWNRFPWWILLAHRYSPMIIFLYIVSKKNSSLSSSRAIKNHACELSCVRLNVYLMLGAMVVAHTLNEWTDSYYLYNRTLQMIFHSKIEYTTWPLQMSGLGFFQIPWKTLHNPDRAHQETMNIFEVWQMIISVSYCR